MLLIRTGQQNTLVVTVSQNATIPNPEWLFSFTHIFSKRQVQFIPTNVSTHKTRYDEFVFVEGTGGGEIQFPYEGLYTYGVYQQTQGSGNLNPQLSQGIIEAGEAQVIVQSANTTNDYYIEYVSNNEYNSNYIFAPGEITPSETISVYSQVLDFISPTQYNSIVYRCDGTQVKACYGCNNQYNITDLVDMFNTLPNPLPGCCVDPTYCYCWSQYGTYYDNGDGRVRCEMTQSAYNTLCPNGTLTLDVIYD
jgi:hypothetical protein